MRFLGEQHAAEFFRVIVESLADSFDSEEAEAYKDLMRAWIPRTPFGLVEMPKRIETVYVLSRVTLGADIKITSVVLDAMKRNFPKANILLVGGRKSAELFAEDARIGHIEADYPRSGPVSQRIQFAHKLRRRLNAPHCIVLDPDSRMSQLGLVPVCDPRRWIHFPSRSAIGADNLSELTNQWLEQYFDHLGYAYIAPARVEIDGDAPRAAISFGVGENESKRIGGDFEAQAIRALGQKYRTLWIDRGAGGDEARRVTAAVEASGRGDRVRFWEGSFAGFASIISQCELYVGYDSAGQHAAAALGVPLITIFRGAPSAKFRQRWAPTGPGKIDVINADSLSPAAILGRF